jgi:hypothetical protein
MPIKPPPIVGIWSLQSFTERDIKTNAVSYPMGEKPKATVIYRTTCTWRTARDRRGSTSPISDNGGLFGPI